MATEVQKDTTDNYKYGWFDADAKYENVKKRGLDEAVIREISQTYKHEPQWMFDRRLKAFRHYLKRAMPDGSVANAKKLRDNALSDFCDFMLSDGSGEVPDRLDYYEINFADALKTLRSPACSAW